MSDGDACMRWRNKRGQARSATDTDASVNTNVPTSCPVCGALHDAPWPARLRCYRLGEAFKMCPSRFGHAGRASSQYSPSQKRCFRCTRRLSLLILHPFSARAAAACLYAARPGKPSGAGRRRRGTAQRMSTRLYSRAELEQSPSRRQGLDAKKETLLRWAACDLIKECGQRLKM
jgi:hypothetical protein